MTIPLIFLSVFPTTPTSGFVPSPFLLPHPILFLLLSYYLSHPLLSVYFIMCTHSDVYLFFLPLLPYLFPLYSTPFTPHPFSFYPTSLFPSLLSPFSSPLYSSRWRSINPAPTCTPFSTKSTTSTSTTSTSAPHLSIHFPAPVVPGHFPSPATAHSPLALVVLSGHATDSDHKH